MKALSVKQPWAALIASGEKPYEVRTWRTDYRGPLVICAFTHIAKHGRWTITPDLAGGEEGGGSE